MSNAVVVEQTGEALIVRFNRPETRNPLSIDVVEQLTGTVSRASHDIGRMIFTGTDGVFAAGADLREIDRVSVEDAKEFARRGQELMQTIANAPFDTIAAINGACFGGGLDLALSCDVRIAAEMAEFCHPGVGLGIITGWGGTQRLPRLIGTARALDMFMTARRVSAEQALHCGLIDSIAADPVREAMKWNRL